MNAMQKFSDRLNAIMNVRGYPKRGRQPELAKITGLTPNGVRKWLKGLGIPGMENAIMLAEAMDVSVEWLLTGRGSKEPEERLVQTTICQEGFDREYTFIRRETFLVEAFAGSGAPSEAQLNELGPLAFQTSWLAQAGLNPKHLVVFPVDDNSMLPDIPHGSVLLVDQSQKTIIDGKVYVLSWESTLRIKRLQKLPGGRLLAISDNPNTRDVAFGPDDEHVDFRVFGRVVWVGKEV